MIQPFPEDDGFRERSEIILSRSAQETLNGAHTIEEHVELMLRAIEDERIFSHPVTDIFLDEGRPPVVVSNDTLYFTNVEPVAERIIESAKNHLKPSVLQNFISEKDADGRFKLERGGLVRMHLFMSGDNLGDSASAALRLQPPKPFKWHDMQLPDVILELIDKPQGMVLFSGPVGSRKTSACHAALDWFNDRVGIAKHIYIVEDPPEFEHEDVGSYFHLREIGHTAKDFPTAIYGALRVRPHIIMIGELRSPETIEAGLIAARLGRTVLSTIHSETTVKTINRVTQAFPAEKRDDIISSLKDNLNGIVNLRTVPTTSGGMALAYEVLVIDDRNNQLLDKPDELIGTLESLDGLNSMEQCLADFAKKGIITPETARKYAPDPTRLRL